jgi:hypothetical protein
MRILKATLFSLAIVGLVLFPSNQAEAAAQGGGTTTITICIPPPYPWLPPLCTTFVINTTIPQL